MHVSPIVVQHKHSQWEGRISQPLTKETYYPFFVSVGCPFQVQISLSSRWQCHWHGREILYLSQRTFSLLTTIPRVGSRSSHVSILLCLGCCIIHYQFGLVYRFDEPYFQLLYDLFFDFKEPFRFHAFQFLLDRHHVRKSINVMSCYLEINARNIFIRPCKHFLEFSKKFFKIIPFLFI